MELAINVSKSEPELNYIVAIQYICVQYTVCAHVLMSILLTGVESEASNQQILATGAGN